MAGNKYKEKLEYQSNGAINRSIDIVIMIAKTINSTKSITISNNSSRLTSSKVELTSRPNKLKKIAFSPVILSIFSVVVNHAG